MFIPVMFACLVNGQCMFFSDKLTYSFQACEAAQQKMEQLADKAPQIVDYATACIEIKGGKEA